MSWIAQEDLKAIRAQADIVNIVSQYIPIEKKGRHYRALCPFHNDHDPSMQINPDKQIAYCFVCHGGGDVFSFVRQIENISFPQAVARVAEMIHYPLQLPQTLQKPVVADPHEADYALMESYASFCSYELFSQSGVAAEAYLKERKVSREIIDAFQIGYAPDSKKSLHYLHSKFPETRLEELSLVRLSGQEKAVFENRIMIPIHDLSGHTVGFTARILPGMDGAKYINSSQNVIYNKSRLIFNYHRAKKVCQQAGRVILCEGAMDVIGLAKAGMMEGIATLGTACTQEQLEAIAKLRVEVRVFYDADKAGRDACYRFCTMAMAAKIPFSIVDSAGAKDPDEIFNTYGAKELIARVDKTISYVQFLFDYLTSRYNLDNYEDKKEYAAQIAQAIGQLSAGFEQESYYQLLKEKTGFDFTPKPEASPSRKSWKSRLPVSAAPAYLPAPAAGLERAEKSALYMMLHSRTAARSFENRIGFFQNPVHNLLSLYIYDFYRSQDQIDPYALMARIDEEEVRELLSLLIQNPYDLDVQNHQLFDDILAKIEDCALESQLAQLNEKMKNLADPLEKARLAGKKQELIKARHRVRDRKEG